MSTFAVFGMTAAQALADARKSTKNTKPSGKQGVPPVEITLEEWLEAVQRNADAIMAGVKVKQLSTLFDTPQHARQFIDLAKKAGACRDLKIRCKAALLDEKGKKILSPKTRMPVIGWADWRPESHKAA
ncbi:hypothetical protein [Pseudomonas putida]|uniref:hypothetical protein n=1 Tax=Pseudomonas putida TaxID=303 RepID=UPI0003F74533|nr:hypothetical protein [Pseudomonas putida]